jgi:hypothetical protein
VKKLPPRDKKGRFVKVKPPLLDPALVRQLGEGRKAVDLFDANNYDFIVTHFPVGQSRPPGEGEDSHGC